MKRRKTTTAFCAYCKRGPLVPGVKHKPQTGMTFTFDHVFPQHMGSKGKWVPACYTCNQLKGGLHPAEWFFMVDNCPRYWKQFKTTQEVDDWIRLERVRRAWAGETSLINEYLARRERAYREKFLARDYTNLERHIDE